MLDTMVSEALCIRSLLGLPEREKDDSQNSDVGKKQTFSEIPGDILVMLLTAAL